MMLPIDCFTFLLVLVVGVAGKWIWQEDALQNVPGEFGIIFDAGGSGTRMYVYELDPDANPKQTKYIQCESRGLSKYTNLAELEAPLKACLKKASDLPADTPIWFEATAGMRMKSLVDPGTHDAIWSKVKEILSDGKFKVKIVQTMPGQKEAEYSWTTVNSLIDTNTGMLEMGSSSLQIAFTPKDVASKKKANPNDFAHVKVNGKEHDVYVHSYLCLGMEESTRRYYAFLLSEKNYPTKVDDPCTFKEVPDEDRSYDDIFRAPCVKGKYAKDVLGGSYDTRRKLKYTFVGKSNYDKCLDTIGRMFSKACEHDKNCGINGAYQPKANGPFYTVGTAIYYAALFAGVTGESNEQKMEEGTRKLFNTTLSEAKAITGYNKWSKGNCFTDAYIVYLLKNVLQLKKTDSVNFVKKINGNKLSWTFGAAIIHGNEETMEWYCAVSMKDGVQSATTDLATAQGSLASGSSANRQAIIPMSGTKSGDPHDLDKTWSTGSMWWGHWNDIKTMQAVCEKVKPPTKDVKRR